jgi:NAD(P)-dependent dehydrogenase (short-subunit alcohol dehydrogenase family)
MSASRIVLITGVTRGLGSAMAHSFAEQGHTVIGCGRAAEGIAQIRKELGSHHRFNVLDVRFDVRVKNWSRQILEAYGPPDLLINNAAVVNRNAPLWEVPADEFSTLIDVNIKGVANVLRHFLPAMVARKSGVIVNFSSGWGRGTDAEVAPYCASKWAIEGLTQSLAKELPAGMAAIPLNPGIIDTDMLRTSFGDAAGSYPSAEEWAEVAVPFLLGLSPSDNGRPLTVPCPAFI